MTDITLQQQRHFEELLKHGHFTEADDMLEKHPEMADTKRQPFARKCFRAGLQYGGFALVTRLIEMGAEVHPSVKYEIGEHAVGMAVYYANPQALRAILQQKHQPVDINIPGNDGYGPLNCLTLNATTEEHLKRSMECARLLFDAGADINVVPAGHNILCSICQDHMPITPEILRMAALRTHDVVIPLADIPSPVGRPARHPPRTPMFLGAITHYEPPLLQALIEGGVDAYAVNGIGQNAFNLTPRTPAQQQTYQNNRQWLGEFRQAARENIRAERNAFPPKLAATYLAPTPEAQSRLHTLLSLDLGCEFFAPKQWEARGGAEAGIAFAQGMREALSPHRSHLRERVDDIALKRECNTPRQESVLVAYACAGNARKRA